MIKVYCYSRCGTCKKALKWLDENNIEHEDIDIKTVHPDKETLKKYYAQSGLPLKRFFNTSGIPYRELGAAGYERRGAAGASRNRWNAGEAPAGCWRWLCADWIQGRGMGSKTQKLTSTIGTSGVVCPQVGTNYPRGRSNPKQGGIKQ